MSRKKTKKKNKNPISMLIAGILVIALALLAVIGIYLRSGISFDKDTKKTVVVLDAGHDFSQPGNVGIITENEYANALCAALQELLEQDSHYEVLLTHEAEEDASLETRQQRLDAMEADVVISLHAVYDPFAEDRIPRLVIGNSESANYKRSLRTAEAIQKELKTEEIDAVIGSYSMTPTYGDRVALTFSEAGSSDASEGEARTILSSDTIPVVVVELVNVNNSADVEELASEEGIAKTAKCIYDALDE